MQIDYSKHNHSLCCTVSVFSPCSSIAKTTSWFSTKCPNMFVNQMNSLVGFNANTIMCSYTCLHTFTNNLWNSTTCVYMKTIYFISTRKPSEMCFQSESRVPYETPNIKETLYWLSSYMHFIHVMCVSRYNPLQFFSRGIIVVKHQFVFLDGNKGLTSNLFASSKDHVSSWSFWKVGVGISGQFLHTLRLYDAHASQLIQRLCELK